MKNKSASQSVLICLFTVLAFTVYISPARATSTSWINATSGDWFNCMNNWSSGCPDSTTDAYVNNSGTAQVNSPNAIAQSLTLGLNPGNSGAVSVDGPAPNGRSLVVPDGCTNEEGIFPGLIAVGYSGTGTLKITNGGTVSSGGGYIAAVTGSLMPPNGAVTVDGAGSSWIIQTCSSSPARLFIGGTATDPGGTALLSVTNGGEVTVNNLSHLEPNVRVGRSGTLTGNGTIKTTGLTTFTAVLGTLAPNWTLNIDGDLALTPSATTQCNVTPQNAPPMVDVSVSQTAALDGRLLVTMTGTFTPGTTFTLLHADGGLIPNTTFSSVSINYPPNQDFIPVIVYDYTGNRVYLYLEPNT